MRFEQLVRTSAEVAATRSRLAKRAALSALLALTDPMSDPDEVEIVITYLAGELRQRRTGIGWASLRSLPAPAPSPSLTVRDVDARLQQMADLTGPGSAGKRGERVSELFARATAEEQDFLRRLLTGAIGQGALDSAMLDALADASGVSLAQIRRAVMLSGTSAPVAVAALGAGSAAVAAIRFAPGRAVRPMLASSAPDVSSALATLAGQAGGTGTSDAAAGGGADVSVDLKLDGIRLQVHKVDEVVRLFTRSLDDVTDRLPEVVALVAGLPARVLVLDGEAITVDASGRPRPFQETASRTGSAVGGDVSVSAFFFDCLAVDDDVLIDLPLADRLRHLDRVVPSTARVPRLRTSHTQAAQDFFDQAIADGHEGVVAKSLAAAYGAGRRGAAWIKVKPRHTLDLVVLAVEWGSGRRAGMLSNIHLGARDPAGGFVMLGKTFKGMTDEMLAWQTARFQELATATEAHVVRVRPEQVVEIAFDGVQRSTRYPGGVALRFARVLRYRDDKTADEADTLDTVQTIGTAHRLMAT